MPLVFVYGTLMRNGANHGVMRRLGGRFVSTAITRDRRKLVDLGPYPALLRSNGSGAVRVAGEIWEIDEEALHELDAFEGCPDLYSRERIVLVANEGRAVEAFAYVLAKQAPAHARVITSGRYTGRGMALPTGAAPEQFSTRTRESPQSQETADSEGTPTLVLDNLPPTEDGSPSNSPR